MGANSKIEWTTHTFNPWRGCYADRQAKQNPGTLGIWGEGGTRVLASESMWREPIKWNKAAACYQTFDCNAGDHSDACPQKNRPRVFCASMADVFEDWQGEIRNHAGRVLHRCSAGHILPLDSVWVNGIECDAGCTLLAHPLTMDDARSDLFNLIDATPNLDWLLLTKRPQNIARMLPAYSFHACETGDCPHDSVSECGTLTQRKFRDNVWLGTSIATQEDADKNIPELLKCRELSPVLFVSAEPLLGPVEINAPSLIHGDCSKGPCSHTYGRGDSPLLDWLIVGGESGPKARPMHPGWARSLRDQCQAAGVPFFFKQWGEYGPKTHGTSRDLPIRFRDETVYMSPVGKRSAGRLLDGREWNEFPRVEVSA